MDTTKDTTMQPVTDVAIVPEATAEFIAGLLERIEQLESDLATAEQDSRQKQARIDRLEGEESKQAALLDCLNEWKELAKSAEKERDALRAKLKEAEENRSHFLVKIGKLYAQCDALHAKIKAMEKQEPVAWLHETRRDSDVVTDAVKHVWGRVAVGSMAAYSIPLYALPGAQGEEK